MHLGMILTIFRKDVRDAIRDSRVIAALLIPIGIGLFYNFTFGDDGFVLPPVSVAYAAEDATELPARLEEAVGGVVRLEIVELDSPGEVRRRVADEDADIGIMIPQGFDEAVQAGGSPALDLVVREQPGTGASLVLAALEEALRSIAGRAPPAALQVDVIPADENGPQNVFDAIGPREYFVLASIIMLIGMNSLLVVPLILAEEAEKKTLDALVMVASYSEVIAAKALVGLFYVGASVAALVILTGLVPANVTLFAVAVVLFALSLIGIGLLIGSVFTNANQVNTWAGFFLLPVIAPAFMVGFPLPDVFDAVLSAISTSQAMRLLINAHSGETFFADVWLSLLVLVVWTIAAYGLLTLRLSRRQA